MKTEAHLHIPMVSGNVMKIPLSSISEQPDEHPINLSDEVNKSGIWQHIRSEASLQQEAAANRSLCARQAG